MIYKTHLKNAARIENCDDLWNTYWGAVEQMEVEEKSRRKTGTWKGRCEKSWKSWIQAIKRRSLELDTENDMHLRG